MAVKVNSKGPGDRKGGSMVAGDWPGFVNVKVKIYEVNREKQPCDTAKSRSRQA